MPSYTRDGQFKVVGPGADGIAFTGITDGGALLGHYSGGSFLLEQAALQALPNYLASEYTTYYCLSPSTGVLAGNY